MVLVYGPIHRAILAAKDVDTARKGALFGGYLKLLPLFIFMMPGVVAFALAEKNPELLSFGTSGYDAALPLMVKTVLPTGLKGLVVAGLLAALMSSLSSVFNSTSTLITFDIYKKYRPEASDKELVNAGRIFTIALVAFGIGCSSSYNPFRPTSLRQLLRHSCWVSSSRKSILQVQSGP